MIAESIIVVVASRIGQYLSGMNQVKAKAAETTASVSKAGSSLTSSFSGLAGLAGIAGVAGAALAALGAAKWSVGVAANAEQAKVAFGVLLQSTAKANTLYRELQDFAAKSGFGEDQLQKASKTMLSFGLAGGKVIPALKSIAEITAGDSERLQSLTLAFSQSASAGRLMGQDLLQMINAGFNPLQEISRKTGKSIGDLKKEMEEGKVPFAMVNDAFKSATSEGGLFAGMLEKQRGTLTGVWNALLGTVSKLGITIGNLLSEVFNFKGAINSLNSFTTSFQSGIEYWKPVILAWKDFIVAELVVVQSIFLSFVGFFQTVFQPIFNLLGNVFGNSMDSFREKIISVFAFLQFVISNFPRYWDISLRRIQLNLITFYEDVKNIFFNLPQVFVEVFNIIGSIAKNFASNLYNIIQALSAGSMDFDWQPLLSGAEDAMKRLGDITSREMTATEKMLGKELSGLSEKLDSDAGQFVEDKLKALLTTKEEIFEALTDDKPVNTGAAAKKKGGNKETKASEALQKGSVEAAKAIADSQAQAGVVTAIEATNEKLEGLGKKLDTIATNTEEQLGEADL